MNVSGKHPNPQGKGLSPVLENLQQTTRNLSVPAKDIHRIADELFTSLFVLHSQIRFKPVCGRKYWLYRKNANYQLSLIAPDQRAPAQSGRYVGVCQLQKDLTWTLELSEQSRDDQELISEITRQRERFDQKMRQAKKVESLLPAYIETMPYYSRMLATALTISFKQSMKKSNINNLSFVQAEKILNSSKN